MGAVPKRVLSPKKVRSLGPSKTFEFVSEANIATRFSENCLFLHFELLFCNVLINFLAIYIYELILKKNLNKNVKNSLRQWFETFQSF